MTASIIDFCAARRQLRPSVKSNPDQLAQLLVSERMFGDVPFASGLQPWAHSGDLP